ncbi:MAG: hypothetical protein C0405_14950, partial [Desulfovibrio sp.]|nr:hypothetical protein [Desulfovibrio sp.]
TTASTTRGGVVGSFSLAQSQDKFYDLQKQVVANIIKVNNIKVDKDTENAVLRQFHTRSFQAVTYFGRGLDAQDRGDYQASKDYFALAVKEDPNFGMARSARDRSPGGLSGGLVGGAAAVSIKTIEGAVSAQKASDDLGAGKFGSAAGGSSGKAGHGASSCS